MDTRVFRKSSNVLTRMVAGETILVPIRGNFADMQKVFTLNPLGVFVWEHLDGREAVEQIAQPIGEEFDVSPEEARADLLQFLEDLLAQKLVEEVKQGD